MEIENLIYNLIKYGKLPRKKKKRLKVWGQNASKSNSFMERMRPMQYYYNAKRRIADEEYGRKKTD